MKIKTGVPILMELTSHEIRSLIEMTRWVADNSNNSKTIDHFGNLYRKLYNKLVEKESQ